MPQYDEMTKEQLKLFVTPVNVLKEQDQSLTHEQIRRDRLAGAERFIEDRIARMSDGDTQFLERKQRITANVQSFRTRYADAAQQDRMEHHLRETRQTVFHKGMSKSQLGKRKKAALKKQQTTLKLMEADRQYLETREGALKSFMLDKFNEQTRRSMYLIYNKVDDSNPYFNAFSDYAAYYESVRKESETRRESEEETEKRNKLRADVNTMIHKANLGRETQEQNILDVYYRQIIDVDLQEFDYATDEEFADKYAKLYPKLRGLAGAKEIITAMQKNGGGYKEERTAVFFSKVDTLSEILADYEARKDMLTSPYYILLARKDVADLSPGKLKKLAEKPHVKNNAGLLDYVNHVLTLKQSTGFKMGGSAAKIAAEKEKKYLKAEYETTKKKVRDILNMTGFRSVEDAIKASQTSELTFPKMITEVKRLNMITQKADDNCFGNVWLERLKEYQDNKLRAEYRVEDAKIPTFMQMYEEYEPYMDEETKRIERQKAEELDRSFELYYLRGIQQWETINSGRVDDSFAYYAREFLHAEEGAPYSKEELESFTTLKKLMLQTDTILMDMNDNMELRYQRARKQFNERAEQWKPASVSQQ